MGHETKWQSKSDRQTGIINSPRSCCSGRINAVNSQLISYVLQSLLGFGINSSSHDYSLPERNWILKQSEESGHCTAVQLSRRDQRTQNKPAHHSEEMSTRSEPVTRLVDCILFQKKTRVTSLYILYHMKAETMQEGQQRQ